MECNESATQNQMVRLEIVEGLNGNFSICYVQRKYQFDSCCPSIRECSDMLTFGRAKGEKLT